MSPEASATPNAQGGLGLSRRRPEELAGAAQQKPTGSTTAAETQAQADAESATGCTQGVAQAREASPLAGQEPEGVWPLGSHRRPIGKLSQSAAQLRGLAQLKPMPRPPDAPPDALEAFAEAMELNAEAAAALRAAPPAVQRRVLGEAGEVPKGRSASAAVRFRAP